MNNTIIISQSAYKELVTRLSRLEKMVLALVKKLEAEPQEGSDDWWEQSDKRALEEIKKGQFVEFDSAKDMVNFLNKQ